MRDSREAEKNMIHNALGEMAESGGRKYMCTHTKTHTDMHTCMQAHTHAHTGTH